MVRLIIIFYILHLPAFGQKAPDQEFGKLFTDVQLSRIFPDSKTFVDAIPKRSSQAILQDYYNSGNNINDTVALRNFVVKNFKLPEQSLIDFKSSSNNLIEHLQQLWIALKREKDSLVEGSSLLPLPHPYIVPGGRFREIYYWDSYFTMLGLKESGETEMISNMIKNFSYLVKQYGLIPNGNRTYYLTRSQPPFFSSMVDLLAGISTEEIYKEYSGALASELQYWNQNNSIHKKGRMIYQYRDAVSIPRQESYAEDVETAEKAWTIAHALNPFLDQDSFKTRSYQHLRAGAASGWDFSTRWFEDGANISTIRTGDIIPVDLNCLLWNLERTVKDPNKTGAGKKQTRHFKKLFFNKKLGWYCDQDMLTGKVMDNPTLAGMYPLFYKLADQKEVPRIVEYLEKNFLKNGGVVTSLENSGEQWDAPNGWAPLQWITIIGLENYGYHDLAKEIAFRWYTLNKDVFARTGKMMEKYNVVDTSLEAGGGEYPSQDGFGWTNGVLLALIKKYNFN
jgi:alpha,alpha-trehalase